jgi:hypothetical protein
MKFVRSTCSLCKLKFNQPFTTSLDSCIGRSFVNLTASFVENETAYEFGTTELFEKDLFADPYH